MALVLIEQSNIIVQWDANSGCICTDDCSDKGQRVDHWRMQLFFSFNIICIQYIIYGLYTLSAIWGIIWLWPITNLQLPQPIETCFALWISLMHPWVTMLQYVASIHMPWRRRLYCDYFVLLKFTLVFQTSPNTPWSGQWYYHVDGIDFLPTGNYPDGQLAPSTKVTCHIDPDPLHLGRGLRARLWPWTDRDSTNAL